VTRDGWLILTDGIVVGGSSAINAMNAIFPSCKIFDIWAELGNPNWNAAAMAPYVKKFQAFNPPHSAVAKDLLLDDYMDYSLYGTDGPVQTNIPNWHLPLTKIWADTWKGLKLLTNQDPITGRATGAFTPVTYIDSRTAQRSHAGVAYWEPASTRKNLTMITGAMVEKIVLEKSSTGIVVATGVKYRIEGQDQSQVAQARKEVILSAGAFNSPALLEVSGIGDEDLLKSLGVDLVISNPNVGENLQDHPMVWMQFDTSDEYSLDSLKDPEKAGKVFQDYLENKTGPLSTVFNAGGLFPIVELIGADEKEILRNIVTNYTKNTTTETLSEAQQIQRNHLLSIMLDSKDSTCTISGAGASLAALLGGQVKSRAPQLSILMALLHPLSRGRTHIQSSDTRISPTIDPKYLSHPLDLEIFARHILHVKTLVKAQPLASIITPGGEMFPAKLENLEDAKAWARESCISQYHPSGTCAMLPEEMGGVLNDRLLVYGTKNLRVVDASIFPMIQKGPFVSSVYAVAEKAADIIKQDLRSSSFEG
jgi:choline dehydrogenase-like flavoprotein